MNDIIKYILEKGWINSKGALKSTTLPCSKENVVFYGMKIYSISKETAINQWKHWYIELKNTSVIIYWETETGYEDAEGYCSFKISNLEEFKVLLKFLNINNE